MDTAISEERLKEILDWLIREVTEDSTGIRLIQGELEPGDDACTVHISFRRGFRSSLSLRADVAMLTRLAQSILKKEDVTRQDMEDVAKEYFNVLCGHLTAVLYKATRIPARFSVPTFHWGAYNPEDRRQQFALNYSGEGDETAQLVHHIPCPEEGEGGENKN